MPKELNVIPSGTRSAPLAEAGARSPVRTLAIGCLGVALVVGSMVAFNTALGPLAAATSASQTQLNWFVDGYTVVLACLLLPAGAISDRYGRRAGMAAGLVVFAMASVSPAIFDTPAQIIAARMVAGAGAAFVMPATLSLLTHAYPPSQRGRAIGLWAATAGCAGVAGMVGSGVLLHFWDWRAICWALGGAAVVTAAAVGALAPSRAHDAPPLDWRGAVVIAAAVAVVVAALLDAPHRGWTDPITVGGLVAGIALGGVFVVVERRLPYALVDVRMFADPRFTAAVATVTALFAATFAFFFLAMQYLQLILGFTALVTALAFAPFVLPVVGLSALSVRYTPRIGQHWVLPVGLAVIGCGFLSMLALERDSSYLRVALCVVVVGAGIGLCTAPATTAIMAGIGEDRQGIGSAINDAAREIGAALGFALAGSVLADRYTSSIAPRLADWPAPVRASASDSLGAALHLAHLAGPQGSRLAALGMDSFVSAMHTSAVVMAATAIVAAVFVGWRSPRDPHALT